MCPVPQSIGDNDNVRKVVFYWDQPLLVGWVFFVFFWGKNRSRLFWLIIFFIRPHKRLKGLETVENVFAWSCRVIVAIVKDYSRELPRFNRERLEGYAIENTDTGRPLYVFVANKSIWNEQNLWGLWIKLWNCISKLHLGLNIPIRLNETLIDSCVMFVRLPVLSEASFYEITFGPIEHDLRVKDDMNKFR